MDIKVSSWKVPHIFKIFEAYSVIADARYEKKDNYLLVYSSDYKKRYTVENFIDGYASNDNMSYNNGILGYPIVVNLALEGKIYLNRDIAILFKGINWTDLNEKCKKDFTLSFETVMAELTNQGIDTKIVRDEVNNVYNQLLLLLPSIGRKEGNYCYTDSFIHYRN